MSSLISNRGQGVSSSQLFFVALFTTALITAQVVASKLLAVKLPVVGLVALPAGTFAYVFTFFATDCMSELYGKQFARKVVNIAFLMNFVLFALIYAAVVWPAGPHSIDPGMFETVLLASGNIIMGSLAAYVVSQNFDVIAFHWFRDKTDAKHLWLRNIGSTGVSQFIDTAIFTVVAFWVAPQVLGIGAALPVTVITSIIVGQYVAKLLIAIGDTPLVYLVTGLVQRSEEKKAVARSD